MSYALHSKNATIVPKDNAIRTALDLKIIVYVAKLRRCTVPRIFIVRMTRQKSEIVSKHAMQ
jgi:hypothetical protein